ncbi:MAG: T9SS type A sorting domain-containing protein [Bacteroidales bacterium]
MKRFLLLPLLFLSIVSFAQEFAWVKTAGYYETDKGMRCAEDNQGNLIFAGSFTDSIKFGTSSLLKSNGKTDFYLLKTNAQGENLWVVSGGGGTLSCEATAVDVDADNNIYIGGFFKDTLTIGTTEVYGYLDSNSDCFIAKFNTSGDLVWVKTFVGPLGDQIEDLDVSGNAIYATGRYKSTISINGTEFSSEDANVGNGDNPFVVALDLNGSTLWIDKVDTPSGFSRGVEVSADGKVNVVFELKSSPYLRTVGTSNVQALKISNSGSADGYIARLNPETGAMLWSNRMGSTGSEMIYAITSDSESNVFVGGIYQSTVTLESTVTGTSATSTSKGSFDIFLGKYDANGKLCWSDFEGTEKSDNVLSLAVNSNNHLYMVGYTLADSIKLGDFALKAPSATINSIIARYSPDGAITWADMATSLSGSFYINSIAITANNSLLFNGYYKGEGTFYDDTNLPNEFTTSNIVYARLSDPTVWVKPDVADDLNIVVYPNPTSKQLYFNAPDNSIVGRVRVVNLIGQEMINAVPQSNSISVDGLPAGIYLVQFSIDGNVVTKKVIVK